MSKKKLLESMGAERKNGYWRIYIETGGPPVTLTRQEEEWNRMGGRPIGKNKDVAIAWLKSEGHLPE